LIFFSRGQKEGFSQIKEISIPSEIIDPRFLYPVMDGKRQQHGE